MKIEDLYNELVALAKSCGVTIRREQGNFRGSHCLLRDQKIILVNKNSSFETAASIVARSLLQIIDIEQVFLSPALRNFMNREMERNKR